MIRLGSPRGGGVPVRELGAGLPGPLRRRLADGRWLRIAHRGAPRVAPGNTRGALEAAAALGLLLLHRLPGPLVALGAEVARHG